MRLFPAAEGEKSECSGGVELFSTAILWSVLLPLGNFFLFMQMFLFALFHCERLKMHS